MQTIYKYPFKTTYIVTLEMPAGARIMCVQVQNGTPCIWAMVDSDEPVINRKFEVIGTGIEIKGEYNRVYIGTYQLFGGDLIFHLFEI